MPHAPSISADPTGPVATTRSRDAAQTRQQLLAAARRRFAFDGYSSTTVRDIATDVGVNVALINRYFDSKEGLFEACITSVGDRLRRPEGEEASISGIAASIVRQLADSTAKDDPAQLQLLLLLRSSGDARADDIRRTIIRTYAEQMAATSGAATAGADFDRMVLRAQVVLSTAFGLALLRTSSGVEPLTSATEAELLEPVNDVVVALLGDTAHGD